ncbi:MAG TPA: ROK family protein, partial [Agromyces sp.]
LARALAQAGRSGHPVADVTVLVDGAVAGAPPVVIMDARFGIEPVDLHAELRARVGALADVEPTLLLPLTLEPAALAAASAEHIEFGIADLLYLAGDTGIASAMVADGVPLLGAHGLAASTFAHLPVVEDGILCECGQRGCLATVASAEQVLERAGLGHFADANGRVAALEELVTRIEAADDRARWSWLDAARWIGRALQLVTPTVDPAIVVIGGYWSHLVDDIDTAYRANRPTLGGGALVVIPSIAPARVGTDAAFHGARRRSRDRLVAEPLLLAG